MKEANLLFAYTTKEAYIFLKAEGDVNTYGVSYNFTKPEDIETFQHIGNLVSPRLFSSHKPHSTAGGYKAFALQYHLSNVVDNENFNKIKEVLQIA